MTRRTRTTEADWIEQLPGEYLDCRVMTHAEKAYTAKPDGRGLAVTLICERCRRKRTIFFDSRHWRTGRSVTNYSEAVGYLAPKGTGPADKPAIAARWLENLGGT
jgi:hypothetical protein